MVLAGAEMVSGIKRKRAQTGSRDRVFNGGHGTNNDTRIMSDV